MLHEQKHPQEFDQEQLLFLYCRLLVFISSNDFSQSITFSSRFSTIEKSPNEPIEKPD